MQKQAKILILEDDPYFVYPIRCHLEKAGYEITVMDIMKNLEASQEMIFQYSPNIILCDIKMQPTGFEILKVIKNHTQLRFIPFIFLTGVESLPDQVRAYLGGVDDFIIKPIEKDVLLAKITSILNRQANLESAIYLDALTQIYNRRFFEKELARQINLHRRHKDKFTLAMLDLDHFKSINDTFGHSLGDLALIGFTRFIQSQIRSTDIFSRWGGEEFVLIMERSDKLGAVKTLENILNNLLNEVLVRANDQDIKISFSAGVAQFPDDGTNYKELIDAADKATYRAKTSGRSQVKYAE
ncbi:MAG: diguanylate cyclase [Candidatus Marinimicrobia bacterium]|nr:diguanylate cyclase [Candidatus Neomarinimicrobiota bacterium]